MAEITSQPPVQPRPDTMSSWRSSLGALETPAAAVAPVNAPTAPTAISTTPPAKEPAKEPVKQPEAKPEPKEQVKTEPDDLPEDKWPRSAEEWKKFKTARKAKEIELSTERDTIRKERDELTEKMKGLSSVTDAAEFQALKKERDEMEKILRTANIRDNPKFKAHFDGKTNAQIELAKRVVGNDKADTVSKLLSLPDSEFKNQQIREFVSELDIIDQSHIGGVLNSLAQIDSEKQAALAVADKDYESMTAAQKESEQKAQEQNKQRISTLIDGGIKSVTDPTKGHPVFQKREGDEKWNSAVDERVKTVKHLLTGEVPPEKIFETAIHAVAYHQVLNDYNSLQTEHNKLKEQIKALSAAQPSIEGNRRSNGSNGEAETVPIKQGSRPMEVTSGWVQRMKQAQNEG